LLRIETAIDRLTASINVFEIMLKGITMRVSFLEKSVKENSEATATLCDRVHALEMRGDK